MPARNGPAPLPPNVVGLRGTNASRKPRDYVVDPIVGDVQRPAWLKNRARKKFDELVEKFQRRKQQVVGIEDMIAVYAQELAHYENDQRRGDRWNAAQLSALTRLAMQFYDTAAAQIASTSRPNPENPFLKRGEKPPPKGKSPP